MVASAEQRVAEAVAIVFVVSGSSVENCSAVFRGLGRIGSAGEGGRFGLVGNGYAEREIGVAGLLAVASADLEFIGTITIGITVDFVVGSNLKVKRTGGWVDSK